MKTKIIPFDLETAKKIQAGEIDGSIVSDAGHSVKILCFDMRSSTPVCAILRLDNGDEILREFNTCGYNPRVSTSLLIEIPEETPKQNGLAGCDGQCHLCTNDCAQRKCDIWTHGFKIGDKVKFTGSEKIVEIINIEGECAKLIDPKDTESIVYVGRLDTLHLVMSKHEFRPFDKVLVRVTKECTWIPRLFSVYYNDAYIMQDGKRYDFCIPYEGNQRLVGTTDKPKED